MPLSTFETVVQLDDVPCAFMLPKTYFAAFNRGKSVTTDENRSTIKMKELTNIQSKPLILNPKGRPNANAIFPGAKYMVALAKVLSRIFSKISPRAE